MEIVKLGHPYPRISVKANIVRCKHPDIKYSDFERFKKGHVGTFSLESWEEQYGDYDNLPVIKSGDIILNGREDVNGGQVAIRLVDINAQWNVSKLKVYEHTKVFYRVDLLEEINVDVEKDIEDKHRL